VTVEVVESSPQPPRLTRRAFCKFTVLALALQATKFPYYLYDYGWVDSPALDELHQILDRTSIPVVYKPYGHFYTDQVIATPRAISLSEPPVAGITLLKRELFKYPPPILQALKLRAIRLFDKIYSSNTGQDLSINPPPKYQVAGIAQSTQRVLSLSSELHPTTIHHELYHIFRNLFGISTDQEFETIMPQEHYLGYSAYYQEHSPDCQLPPYVLRRLPECYSIIDSNEHQATIAEQLMVQGERYLDNLRRLSSQGDIHPVRVERAELIQDFYKRWSNGAMDQAYWHAISQNQVDQHYF
jgi:hypothetical protein